MRDDTGSRTEADAAHWAAMHAPEPIPHEVDDTDLTRSIGPLDPPWALALAESVAARKRLERNPR